MGKFAKKAVHSKDPRKKDLVALFCKVTGGTRVTQMVEIEQDLFRAHVLERDYSTNKGFKSKGIYTLRPLGVGAELQRLDPVPYPKTYPTAAAAKAAGIDVPDAFLRMEGALAFKCDDCGKETKGEKGSNLMLCPECEDYASWENAHSDDDHKTTPNAQCPVCAEAATPPPAPTQAEKAALRERANPVVSTEGLSPAKKAWITRRAKMLQAAVAA